jgi:hypothetical protein
MACGRCNASPRQEGGSHECVDRAKRPTNDSLSIIQLGLVAGLLVIAAATMRLAFSRRPAAAEPVIEASFKELRQGWYQVDMTVNNRAPYGLVGVSLRRVRPGAARLMAPIKLVSTPQGDSLVWSDPAVDKPATTIPVDLIVGPHEAPHGVVSLRSETHTTAWLFPPGRSAPARVTLDLALRDEAKKLRCYQFIATRESKS